MFTFEHDTIYMYQQGEINIMNRYITKEERSTLYKEIRREFRKKHPSAIGLLIMMDKLPNDSKKAKGFRDRIMCFVKA